MKKVLINTILLLTLVISGSEIVAQEIDSIAFHLYTDSLKKGVHNYINVDGYLREGRWIPLTSKDLRFTTNAGSFEGNNLIIDQGFTGDKVLLTVMYNRNKKLNASTTIYIKTVENNEVLPSKEDVMQPAATDRKSRRKKKSNP